jgi:protein-disulfide isomerase
LEAIHPLAFKAAEASHCAQEQGKFWEMHDRLFANRQALAPWRPHAEALGLDVEQFEQCLNNGRYVEAIRRDMAEARKSGASGTPSFILARSHADDPSKVTGISFLVGAQPFRAFKTAIEQALKTVNAP